MISVSFYNATCLFIITEFHGGVFPLSFQEISFFFFFFSSMLCSSSGGYSLGLDPTGQKLKACPRWSVYSCLAFKCSLLLCTWLLISGFSWQLPKPRCMHALDRLNAKRDVLNFDIVAVSARFSEYWAK